LSAPDRDPAEVYEKERREMRQKSDAELLKVRAMGNEYKKELAQEELQHRKHARNVQTDRRVAKWTAVVSIIALVVSIIAIVVSVH
jgi:type IV secretory pathway component VirB8